MNKSYRREENYELWKSWASKRGEIKHNPAMTWSEYEVNISDKTIFYSVDKQKGEEIKDKLENVKAELIFEILNGWQWNKKVYNTITQEYEQKVFYAIIVKPIELRIWSVVDAIANVIEPLCVVDFK